MKHLIVLCDGMADWPVDKLGGKTLLQYADTPYFDFLARNGRCGMLKTVPDGFHPGSEVANSSILGYDQHVVYEGRGPLEAASIGVELADDDLRQAELENANLHVANSVLDNCLSTLKHETMYYPSRIRQLVDSGHLEQLGEVTRYYRDLYAILIEQALQQANRIPLHVRPVELYGHQVLGDAHLLHYLFELLSDGSSQVQAEVKDASYVVYHVTPPAPPASPFISLVCRQIVRDHGEATNRRACGITGDSEHVNITLPRYHGKV
jgi:hypothetical protein